VEREEDQEARTQHRKTTGPPEHGPRSTLPMQPHHPLCPSRFPCHAHATPTQSPPSSAFSWPYSHLRPSRLRNHMVDHSDPRSRKQNQNVVISLRSVVRG
jgi:hypothetical protein